MGDDEWYRSSLGFDFSLEFALNERTQDLPICNAQTQQRSLHIHPNHCLIYVPYRSSRRLFASRTCCLGFSSLVSLRFLNTDSTLPSFQWCRWETNRGRPTNTTAQTPCWDRVRVVRSAFAFTCLPLPRRGLLAYRTSPPLTVAFVLRRTKVPDFQSFLQNNTFIIMLSKSSFFETAGHFDKTTDFVKTLISRVI